MPAALLKSVFVFLFGGSSILFGIFTNYLYSNECSSLWKIKQQSSKMMIVKNIWYSEWNNGFLLWNKYHKEIDSTLCQMRRSCTSISDILGPNLGWKSGFFNWDFILHFFQNFCHKIDCTSDGPNQLWKCVYLKISSDKIAGL